MKFTAAGILALFTISVSLIAAEFKPPSESERLKAIGNVSRLSPPLQKALQSAPGFKAIKPPGPVDWLSAHKESGQTYDAFMNSLPNKPDRQRTKIYLQPIGSFAKGDSPDVKILMDYCRAFFVMPVELLPELPLTERQFSARTNKHTLRRQLLTTDILKMLEKRLPEDAYCLLAITMTDLYPEPSWNFVFGQATLTARVGVFSFARYDPDFFGVPRGKDYRELQLLRSCKVLSHEIGHMFGIHHCIYFECVMNGSNHLSETDSRPPHLCPVCLRKLLASTRADVEIRYEGLMKFYETNNFASDKKWISERLEQIRK